MILAPRMSTKELAELCHRLAVELEAGIDVRRVFEREAEHAPRRLKSRFEEMHAAVSRGDSVTSALASAGTTFPKMFLEMVQVGEQTGMMAEVFRRLNAHYKHQMEMRRTFLSLIAWPMTQLGIAIFIVGLVIWILGVIAGRNTGEPVDILGFGLIGTSGLITYVNFLILVALCVVGLITAFRRGMLWTKPLQRMAMHVPVLGQALEKICLARLTWALQLTFNVEMDLRRLVPLVLRATGNDYYEQQGPVIVQGIVDGHPLHTSFRSAGIFPVAFLDALEVAEESGTLVESMERLSERYQQEAETAMKTISALAGSAVWLFVAGLIIFLIFRIFSFYVGAINDAVNMTR